MDEKICRLCLRREGEFFDLFAPVTKEKTNVVEELELILNFEIVNDARLPGSVCSNCYKIQAFINEFKLSCSRVNSYLNELLKMSPTINMDGLCGQVSTAVRVEYNHDELAPEKLRHLRCSNLKPLRSSIKESMKGNKYHKKHEANILKENEEKMSHHLNNEFMIDKAWNQSDIIQNEVLCKSASSSGVLENYPSVNKSSSCDLKYLETKVKYVPTSSISDSPVKQEEVMCAESIICMKDSKEAPKNGSRKNNSQDKDPTLMNSQAEKIVGENNNIIIDINNAIYNKLLEIQNSGIRIATGIMKSTALKVALECQMPHFTASNGWLHSFIKRFEIGQKTDEVTLPPNCQGVTLSNGYITRYCCKELNEAVYVVCRELAALGVVLHSDLIKDIARSIAVNEGLYEFSGSTSWFKSFKKHYNIEVNDVKTKRKRC